MLRVFERFMEKLAADWEKTRSFIRQVKTEFHEEIAGFDEVPRTYDVDFEPITAISHDAPVIQPAASKSKPVDISKLKGKALRKHADKLGVPYRKNIGDDTLRARVEEVQK